MTTTVLQPGEQRWSVSRDLVEYRSALEIAKDSGTVRLDDIDLEMSRRAYERYSSTADDFASVCGETKWSMTFARGDWTARTETHTVLSCTAEEFVLHATLDGYEGAHRVFSRNWHRRFPRDLV